jgi:mono/diheme cytochrome c family protein
MLARVDRILEPLIWLVAAAGIVMLLAGPRIVAHDSAKAGAVSYSGGAAPGGQAPARLFSDRCGACHTLSAAGTTGSVGPVLDGTRLDAASVAAKMQSGGGAMPSFSSSLSAAQIGAIATYVAKASGG